MTLEEIKKIKKISNMVESQGLDKTREILGTNRQVAPIQQKPDFFVPQVSVNERRKIAPINKPLSYNKFPSLSKELDNKINSSPEMKKNIQNKILGEQYSKEMDTTKKELDSIYRSPRYNELQTWLNNNTEYKKSRLPESYNKNSQEFEELNKKIEELNSSIANNRLKKLDTGNANIADKILIPFDNISENYKRGSMQEEEAKMWSEYLQNKTPENREKAEKYSNGLKKYLEEHGESRGNIITKDYANYLPQMFNSMKAGIKGAVPGAATGSGAAIVVGQLGPQVGLPEELITVPAAAIKGGQAGYVAGVTKHSYDQMKGLAYKNLTEITDENGNKIPEEIALKVANDEAVINSLIEGGSAVVDVLTLGFNTLVKAPTKVAVKQTTKQIFGKALRNYGINVASEGLEEFLQEGVSINKEEEAIKKAQLNILPMSSQDKLDRQLEAGIGGIKIGAISGLGNAGTTTYNTLKSNTKVPISNSIESINNNTQLDSKTAQNDNVKAIRPIAPVYDFSKQVDDVLDGKFPKNNTLVLLNKTPDILKKIGLNDLPITMTQKHLETISQSSGKYEKSNYHDLGIDVVKQLPEAISNPLNIYKSSTKDDSIVLVTHLSDKNNNIVIASIKIDGKGTIDDIVVDTNHMTSAYGKDNYDYNVDKKTGKYKPGWAEINKDNMIYDIDDGIKKDTNSMARLQLPRYTTNVPNNIIIPQNKNYATNLEEINNSNQKFPIIKEISENNEIINDNLKIDKIDESPFLELMAVNKNANKVSYFSDFYRNMRKVFGEERANEITGSLDKAKLYNVKMQNEYAEKLKSDVVDRLKIKKGSKESALVQMYGEKKINLSELKTLAPKNWRNIIEADDFFRNNYDELVNKINETRKQIYPGVEERLNELEKELYDTNAQIKLIKKTNIAPFKVDLDIKNNIDRLNKIVKDKTDILTNTKNKTTMIYMKNERILNESKQKISELQHLKENRTDNKLYKLKQKAEEITELIDSEELWRGKIINKRKDYYRHFNEMTKGFKALHNILTTPVDISTNLAGTSEFTKPNSKWLGLAQKRLGKDTEYDAVGGFLNYIPSASYAINIDPQIKNLRDFTNQIREVTSESKNANKFIEYMDDFTNGLAGKTNPFDRTLQKVTNRKVLKGIEWVTCRIKSNMILGNLSSSVSQILNLPQVVGKIKNPAALTQGFIDTIRKIGNDTDSQFLQERYNSDIQSQFDTDLIQQPKKFATWMLGSLDEIVTKTGWNALYRQAQVKELSDPVQYADNTMRDLVAGRGIGERTIAQESKMAGLFTPFTVEVGNLWRVMGDFVDKKDFGGLILTFIVANLLNKGLEFIGASGKTFDPIEAVNEALTEKDLTAIERAGRVGGEILSSVPFGQQIATLYPEYGADLGIVKLPTKEKLFGKNDPTRFGTGSIYSSVIKNPLTTVITPWGGKQIEKTTKGVNAILNKGVYNSKNELKYPVKTDIINATKGIAFGESGFKEAQQYYDNNLSPMGEKKTERFINNNIDYNNYIELEKNRFEKISEKIDFINKMKITDDEKFAMYKFEIFSDEIRKDDYSSQLLDAEMAVNSITTKSEYMKLYKEAKEKNINMPKRSEVQKIDIAGANFKECVEFKINTTEVKKQNDKIAYLLKSNISDKSKKYLFGEIYPNKDISYIEDLKLNTNICLEYENNINNIQGIKDKNGKTLSGSKKKAVFDYINKLKLGKIEKIILFAKAGYPDNNYKQLTFDYINKLKLSKQRKQEIWNGLGYK